MWSRVMHVSWKNIAYRLDDFDTNTEYGLDTEL